jgi:hypothetical protein
LGTSSNAHPTSSQESNSHSHSSEDSGVLQLPEQTPALKLAPLPQLHSTSAPCGLLLTNTLALRVISYKEVALSILQPLPFIGLFWVWVQVGWVCWAYTPPSAGTQGWAEKCSQALATRSLCSHIFASSLLHFPPDLHGDLSSCLLSSTIWRCSG